VFITRTNQPVSTIRVDPPLMSDHSLIVASIDVISRRPTENTTVMRRHWRSFDVDVFVAELERSRLVIDPPHDVTERFDCYDATLGQLIDKMAPMRPTRTKARLSAPWFDVECHAVKAETRRLEKAHRRNPSTSSEAAWRSQFSKQRDLFQKKFVDHWSAAIDSCKGDSKGLWSKLRSILQPESDILSNLSAEDHENYFTAKIDRIRDSTAAAPTAIIENRTVLKPLSEFMPTTVEEVAAIIKKSPAKQCQLDPVPIWLAKQAGNVFASIISGMCNASFQQMKLPERSKKAIVRPLLKKRTLDSNDSSSYRPFSNLSFVSKVVERVVDARMTDHINKHQLLPVFQSAYRPFHSTETAVVCIMDAMIDAIDGGHIGALTLLDLSAAFDTVDHSTLLEILKKRFGMQGIALDWYADFLRGRSQVVRVGRNESEMKTMRFGLPQGSVLGPKGFIQYAEDVAAVFIKHGLIFHLYADDMQGLKHG